MILTESKGLRTTLKHGFEFYSSIRGFPDSSVGKESACNAGQPGSIPWLEELLEKGKVTIPVFWPKEFHGLFTLWVSKELNTTE